jgi:hypothetical protein
VITIEAPGDIRASARAVGAQDSFPPVLHRFESGTADSTDQSEKVEAPLIATSRSRRSRAAETSTHAEWSARHGEQKPGATSAADVARVLLNAQPDRRQYRVVRKDSMHPLRKLREAATAGNRSHDGRRPVCA